MLPINQVISSWDVDKQKFENLKSQVLKSFRKEVPKLGIMPEISGRTKDVLSIIKKIKKKQSKTPGYDYKDVNDKLGIRIICNYKDECDIVEKFVYEKLIVVGKEIKSEKIEFDKLSYLSNHYDVKIKQDGFNSSNYDELKDLVFEIQVRTLNQHTWANAAHSLAYKQEMDIADSLKRRLFRLLALYEISDDEMTSIKKIIAEDSSNFLFYLLSQTEIFIYKLANCDYDREFSVENLKIILSFLDDEKLLCLKQELPGFINSNYSKLETIYKNHFSRVYEYPILSQPEVFIIWFLLEKQPYSVKDNWSSHYNEDELEFLESIWGTLIS